MPGRSYNSANLTRGFNGKRYDNEVYGEGSFQDYGMRMYDPRIIRFPSVDPIADKYPELTPYQFASNSPISGIDRDGLEYYYAADGALLGKAKNNNTEVRVIKAENVQRVADLVKAGKATVSNFNAISTPLGITNEELNTRAFMSTFRETENLSSGRVTEYNDLYGREKDGGGKFTKSSFGEAPADYKDHPRKYVKSWGNPTAMSAAGAYMITEETFDTYKGSAGVGDFSPMSQDRLAIRIMNGKAGSDIQAGNVEGAMKKLSKTWSSLPGGVHQQATTEEAKNIFKKHLRNELNGKSIIATPKGQLPTTLGKTTKKTP